MSELIAVTKRRCPRCGGVETVSDGHSRGRPRWYGKPCGRSFGETTGTPLYRRTTSAVEIARPLLVVLRRGSLSAAEELTGHKAETIGQWLRAAAQHAEALTEVLVHDLQLSVVEVDEFWSFVRKKGSLPRRPAPPAPGRSTVASTPQPPTPSRPNAPSASAGAA